MKTNTEVDQLADTNVTETGLPEGWVEATLSDLCEINPPKPPRDALSPSEVVTFVPMPAVNADLGAIANPLLRSFSEVRNGYTSFRDGDVIMAKITPCMENGKAAIVQRLKNGLGFGSTEFHVLRPNGATLAEYIYRFIRQESYRKAAEAEMTGSVGQKRVPADFLKQTVIALPPLAEQKRIVTRIEELLGHISVSHECLAKVPKILKAFRQSVLAAASSGRLTEDWRREHPISQSITDIISDARRRREAEAGSIAHKEKIRQIYDRSELNDSSDLPDGWGYVTLNKICSSFDYGTAAKSQNSGKVPVLRMGNIQEGRIDWSDLVFTSDADEIRRYCLQPNTVLFNRTNSPELVGKTAIYRGERPAIFAGYLIRIIVLPELDAEYLNLCLNTNYAREFCAQVKTDGVSQSNINAQNLGTLEVPYCSLTEQREIVRRVETLFQFADIVEKKVDAAAKRADKLTQSVLANAFRGELVPTEAKLARRDGRQYEPASVLLERINAERGRVAVKGGEAIRSKRGKHIS